MRGEFCPRNFALNTAGKVLDSKKTGLRLVLTEEHDCACDLIGGFKGLFQAERAVAEFNTQAWPVGGTATEFSREFEGCGVLRLAEGSDVCVGEFGFGCFDGLKG